MFWLCQLFARMVELNLHCPCCALLACASVVPLIFFWTIIKTYALCVQERSWHPKVDLTSITLEQLRRAVATAQASAQAADEAARSQQVNESKRCGNSVFCTPACMQSGATSKSLDPDS